jgi:hypothetical protein
MGGRVGKPDRMRATPTFFDEACLVGALHGEPCPATEGDGGQLVALLVQGWGHATGALDPAIPCCPIFLAGRGPLRIPNVVGVYWGLSRKGSAMGRCALYCLLGDSRRQSRNRCQMVVPAAVAATVGSGSIRDNPRETV